MKEELIIKDDKLTKQWELHVKRVMETLNEGLYQFNSEFTLVLVKRSLQNNEDSTYAGSLQVD